MVHAVLLFVFVALFTAGVISAISIWTMATSLMHPPRMSDGKALYVLRRLTPADVNLPFEVLHFIIRDEHEKLMRVAGWWVSNVNAKGRTIVLLHGYADAKVGALAWAPMLHALGFNLFLPDLRAHGESTGDTCTGGYLERHDINQAIDQLREAHSDATKELFLFGVSLGAAVALAVAALRTDIAGVVLDSPFTDFASASAAHMSRLGLPGQIFQMPAIRIAERLSGADYAAVAPVKLVVNAVAPLMMVLPGADIFVAAEGRDRLTREMNNRIARNAQNHLWIVPETAHLMPLVAFPTEYADRLTAFFHQASKIATEPVAN